MLKYNENRSVSSFVVIKLWFHRYDDQLKLRLDWIALWESRREENGHAVSDHNRAFHQYNWTLSSESLSQPSVAEEAKDNLLNGLFSFALNMAQFPRASVNLKLGKISKGFAGYRPKEDTLWCWRCSSSLKWGLEVCLSCWWQNRFFTSIKRSTVPWMHKMCMWSPFAFPFFSILQYELITKQSMLPCI